MENDYEIIDDTIKTDGVLELSDNSKRILNEMSGWTKFLAIMFFILAGVYILIGVVWMTRGIFFDGDTFESFLIIPLAIVSGLVSLPAYYLFRFSNKIKPALINESSEHLESSLEDLKSHFKIVGIYVIISLGFSIISWIVVLATMSF